MAGCVARSVRRRDHLRRTVTAYATEAFVHRPATFERYPREQAPPSVRSLIGLERFRDSFPPVCCCCASGEGAKCLREIASSAFVAASDLGDEPVGGSEPIDV